MAEEGAVSRARVLRRALTPPEARLWVGLRGRQLGGIKFRRQHPVGPFVLDFYCAEARLAVEVDGLGHSTPGQSLHDARRTAWLERRGVTVLRVPAEQVRVNLDAVLEHIRRTVEARRGA